MNRRSDGETMSDDKIKALEIVTELFGEDWCRKNQDVAKVAARLRLEHEQRWDEAVESIRRKFRAADDRCAQLLLEFLAI